MWFWVLGWLQPNAFYALKYLTLICSKIYFGVLFFLYTIEADLYFGVRNIWSLKLRACLA